MDGRQLRERAAQPSHPAHRSPQAAESLDQVVAQGAQRKQARIVVGDGRSRPAGHQFVREFVHPVVHRQRLV